MIGQTISHYQVIEELGGGGMGAVYKARDTKLERFVALKYLPSQVGHDDEGRARFVQEAKAASALDHPNICTIYEIDETEDGQIFIVMAFYNGETLENKIQRGPLGLTHTLDYAIGVATGLDRAHEKGIVHRDVKPANIMVTRRNEVKILDFGLAKYAGQSRITQTGVAVGTLAYMAPEQLQGVDVDHRVDIWGLGALIYTMVAGSDPFPNEEAPALVTSILTSDPPSVLELSHEATPELSNVIQKAMVKDPSRRYQSVREFRLDLVAIQDELEAVAQVTTAQDRAIPSIAVLPFVNMSPDPENEYFSDGLAEELINALTRVDGLKVAARTSAFRFRGRDLDIREIGKKLKVDTILEGSVRKAGKQLRVTAQLINVSDGYHAWSERYDRELDDVFAVQDEISLAIVDKLKARLLEPEKAKLVKRYTENSEAFDRYLRGQHNLNKRKATEFEKALSYFHQAIELDPEYAPPHAGLAETYNLLGRYGLIPPDKSGPQAKAAAENALAIDSALAEAHTALAYTEHRYYWDWERAESEYQRAIELNPKYPGGHHFYGWFLAGQGRLDEAVKEIREAIREDPLSLISNTSLGGFLYFARRYEQAERQLLSTLEIDPQFVVTHQWLGRTYLQQRRHGAAVRSFQFALDMLGDDPETLGGLGYAHANAGQAARAEELLDKLENLSTKRYVSEYWPGIVYLGLGDNDAALEQLQMAVDERSDWMVDANVDPWFDPLRDDPRFTTLLRHLSLPNLEA